MKVYFDVNGFAKKLDDDQLKIIYEELAEYDRFAKLPEGIVKSVVERMYKDFPQHGIENATYIAVNVFVHEMAERYIQRLEEEEKQIDSYYGIHEYYDDELEES